MPAQLRLENFISAFVSTFVLYAAITGLHILLPARTVEGYVTGDGGQPLPYRLNALLILVVTIGAAVLMHTAVPEHFDLAFIAKRQVHMLIAANVIGFAGSIWLYIRGLRAKRTFALRCRTVDGAQGADLPEVRARGVWANIYFGLEFNPRLFGVDLKMLLYLVGAVVLGLNVASAAAWQYETVGTVSLGMRAYAFMFALFLSEYTFFEEARRTATCNTPRAMQHGTRARVFMPAHVLDATLRDAAPM